MTRWSWNRLIARFLEDKRQAGWSPGTLEAAARWLKKLLLWCNERSVMAPVEATAEHVEQFRQTLLCTRIAGGGFYALHSVDQALRMVRQFFHWAAAHEHVFLSPTKDLQLPRIETRLFHLTQQQVAQVMKLAENGGTPTGLRARAVLETLYHGGTRRSECLRLAVQDVDLSLNLLHVTGRNGRRSVALDCGLLEVLERYLRIARPQLSTGSCQALFLSTAGTPYSAESLGAMLRHISRRAGFRVSAHMLRHACAVHRLEDGADLAEVQAHLGLRAHRSASAYADIATASLKRRPRQPRQPQERRRLTHFHSLTDGEDGPESAILEE